MMRRAALALAFAAASVNGSTVYMAEVVPRDGGAVGGTSSSAQIVDMGLGYSQLQNGNRVWLDLVGATFQSVPEWLQGFTTLLPSSQVSSNHLTVWECSNQPNTPFCEIHAFAYPCTGCPYSSGNFIQHMGSLGWTVYKCAPSVEMFAGGFDHKMLGFTKKIPAGTDYTLSFTAALTEFTVFAIDNYPDMCSAHANEGSCLSPDRKGKCDWTGSECTLNTCMGGSIGPNLNLPCTQHCITSDLP